MKKAALTIMERCGCEVKKASAQQCIFCTAFFIRKKKVSPVCVYETGWLYKKMSSHYLWEQSRRAHG